MCLRQKGHFSHPGQKGEELEHHEGVYLCTCLIINIETHLQNVISSGSLELLKKKKKKKGRAPHRLAQKTTIVFICLQNHDDSHTHTHIHTHTHTPDGSHAHLLYFHLNSTSPLQLHACVCLRRRRHAAVRQSVTRTRGAAVWAPFHY